MKINLEDLKHFNGNIIVTDCSIQIICGMGGGASEDNDSGYQGCAIGFDSDQPTDPLKKESEEEEEIEIEEGRAICRKTQFTKLR